MKKYGEGKIIPEEGDPKEAVWTEKDREELVDELLQDAPPDKHGKECPCFRCAMEWYEGEALD